MLSDRSRDEAADATTVRRPPRSRRPEPLARLDSLALSLRGTLGRTAVPLARAAAAFVDARGWKEFGYARLSDHARERFDRTSRWVRDMAALGRAIQPHPNLLRALNGEDGRPPIGRAAALCVARVATRDSLDDWIALARSSTVRGLREAVREARAAGSGAESDLGGAGASTTHQRASAAADGGPADEDERLVRVAAPHPVQVAFAECLELHRAVCGGEATVVSFVEALVAETVAGGHAVDVERVALQRRPAESRVEASLARTTGQWAHLPTEADAAAAETRALLARLASLAARAGRGGAGKLDGQIRELLEIEDELQRRLGALLCELRERGAWATLRFAGTAHYAEQRLGLPRSSALDRARAARELGRFPALRRAYESGRIGLEATLLILRIVGRGAVDARTEQDWVERAERSTVKRLRDERRALLLSRVEPRSASDPPRPLEDRTWHDSLRREPGLGLGRVRGLGARALEQPFPDVFLRLRLPRGLADDFARSIDARRRDLTKQADGVPWDRDWPGRDAAPSLGIARTFSVRCRRVPAWVGLLALLEDYAATWDDPRGVSRRGSEEIYRRDGWRCSAPGCSSRRNLEDHHLRYRSRGGGHEPSNRLCLCRFHHRLGEHGGLASCRGAAPLRVTWRLGRRRVGVLYRNELRLRPAPSAIGRA